MNNKPTNIQSQHKESKNSLYNKTLSNLSHVKISIIDYLSRLNNKYTVINPTQETIATYVDCVRKTVNEHCLELEEMNLIKIIRRRDPYNPERFLPHIYKLPKIFMDLEFRKSMEHLLPSFKIIPIMLILSTFVTENIKGNLFKCNISKKIESRRKPVEFSIEELLQLSQFSKETINYARSIINLDLERGKQISNIFSYFYGICQRHHLLVPKTGKRECSKPFNPLPSSVQKKVIPFEEALNYEKNFHDSRETDIGAWKKRRDFKNPFFNQLSLEEQQQVMAVHQDCKCRPFLSL